MNRTRRSGTEHREPTIRRLGPGDEAILDQLALDDAAFDLAERGGPLKPLSLEAARSYLADPHVLHWIAASGDQILGHLYCSVVRLRAGDPREVLLYEIGVRSTVRGRGIGRSLLDTLNAWMEVHGVKEVWVLADNPGAVAFYRACGFTVGKPPPVYLTKRLRQQRPRGESGGSAGLSNSERIV